MRQPRRNSCNQSAGEDRTAKGTVFVVDDDERMRNALRRLLSSAGLVPRVFSSANEFLQLDAWERPSCLLLDLQMPEMNGLQLQHALQARGIRLPIIFLTGGGTIAEAVTAMNAGAIDFLEKPFRNDKLVARVVQALAIDHEALQRDRDVHSLVDRTSTLTPRERQVIILLSQGQSNKVIARALEISPRTVEGYRAKLMEKLEVKSVAQLVLAVQQSPSLNNGGL